MGTERNSKPGRLDFPKNMSLNPKHVARLISVLILLLPSIQAIASVPSGNETNQQIARAVKKVRAAKTDGKADEASDQLANLVIKIGANRIDDEQLHNIADLLNTSNDGVRYSVAIALGCFGPRAKFAVPKLLEILKEMDCVVLDSPSTATIRPALKKIGVSPPPHHYCDHYDFQPMPQQDHPK